MCIFRVQLPSRDPFAWVGLTILLAVMRVLPPVGAQESPLRYDFRLGDRLVYERRAIVASLETGAVQQQVTDQIQLWCFEKTNADVLVLLDQIHIADGKIEPMGGVVFRCDSRGMRRFSSVMLSRANEMESAFDILPAMRSAAETGRQWTTPPDPLGRTWTCNLQGPDPNRENHVRVGFTVADPTHVSEFLGQERFGTFWFDPRAGLVTRVEAEFRDKSAGVTVQSKTKLQQRATNDAAWTQARAAESAKLVLALENEARLIGEAADRPDELDSVIDRLDRIWSGFAVDIGDRGASPFRPIAIGCRQRALGARASMRRIAEYTKAVVGRRTSEWTLQDVDSRTVRSADMRDLVSVEFLWSAESLWSLRAMESVRRLQQSLASAEKPVARTICMNMDRDVELARSAVRSCGQGLSHVLAEPLAVQNPVAEFPTIRVVDRSGVIRQVVVGWRPDLVEFLTPIINEAAGK